MPYINFARKYRPQDFDDFIGQETVQKTLMNAISSGKIAQAYLFAGPRGVGKTSAARILAKALNCEKGPTPKPCNKCTVCNEITAGTSMDVIEIDGASHTQVDNVREIRDAVKYLPARGKYKVYIIDEVHMLSTSAFNALLKTLEEPPPHSIFIMATTEPRKVPPTVLSRCQRHEFRAIQPSVVEKRLREIAEKEGFRIEDEGIRLIAARSEGSLRDALSLTEQVVSYSGGTVTSGIVREVLGVVPKESIYALTSALIKRDPKSAIETVDNLYSSGFEIKMILDALVIHLRNLAVMHISPELLNLQASEKDDLRNLAGEADQELLLRLTKEFLRIYEQVLRSPSPKFTLEVELLGITAINPVASAKDILRKLDELKIPASRAETVIKKKTPEQQDVINWENIIENAKRDNPLLGAILNRGKPEGMDNEKIKLAFAESDKEMVTSQIEEIRSTLITYLGRDVGIELAWTDDVPREVPTKKKKVEEAFKDGNVKDALEIFEAHIYDVKSAGSL
ncbi:MAG TPA: DNA polymerase III subunit gamma/tau [bacterium]